MNGDDALEVLDVQECLRLLQTVSVGRVVFTESALPAARPVNFITVGDGVVFRTTPGGTLDLAVRGAVVGFEADAFDERSRTGWSVLVVGRGEELTDPEVMRTALDQGLRSWAGGRRDRFIRIGFERVTGRRISHPTKSVVNA